MLVVGLHTEHSDTLDHFILSKSGIIQKKETKIQIQFLEIPTKLWRLEAKITEK